MISDFYGKKGKAKDALNRNMLHGIQINNIDMIHIKYYDMK
jgi:hypothetical protein